MLAGAAAFSLVEILLGVFVGPFGATGRAEALPLLVFRPWLLVALAAALAGSGWRVRIATYAGALAAAGLSESVYLIGLGNPRPWAEMLRLLLVSALILLLADLVLRMARVRLGKHWRTAAALGVAALLLVPGVLRPYRAIVSGPAERPAQGPKPELVLMTALPIVWGEGDAFSLDVRPAGVYVALQEEFTVRPVDTLDRQSFGASKLLLLAQPGWLAPAELVALDEWVRNGGRALILADPRLEWHSELPLGDVRRPPPVTLLGPLLDHWGLKVEEGAPAQRELLGRDRLIAMHQPGRFTATGPACRALRPYHARCLIGRGEAQLLADADLMRDELWMAPGRDGGGRDRRLADNPLILADMLDALAGRQGERSRLPVAWRRPDMSPASALGLALLPLLLMQICAAPLLLGTRRAR